MSLVIFLVLAIWLAGIISKDNANSSAKMRKYYKEYPPRKTREEYFRSLELYLDYRFEHPKEHKNPAEDAVHDARLELLRAGYRVSTFPIYPVDGAFDEFDDRLYKYACGISPELVERGPKLENWQYAKGGSHAGAGNPTSSQQTRYEWDKYYNDFVDKYWDAFSKYTQLDFSHKKEKINFRDSKYPYRGLAIKDGYV